jgi:hypothetical protein
MRRWGGGCHADALSVRLTVTPPAYNERMFAAGVLGATTPKSCTRVISLPAPVDVNKATSEPHRAIHSALRRARGGSLRCTCAWASHS